LPKIASAFLGEMLLLYLVVSEQAISTVLVVDRAKEQIPIYYVSHALAGVEIKYPLIKKFTYTLVSRKLRPYFVAYKVTVLTDQPMKNVV